MPRLRVNGVELYYEGIGEGDPLVLVHGGWGDHTNWSLVVDEFARSSDHARVPLAALLSTAPSSNALAGAWQPPPALVLTGPDALVRAEDVVGVPLSLERDEPRAYFSVANVERTRSSPVSLV